MNIVNNIKNEIMFFNEKYIIEAEDKFNFWDEHIIYVIQEALILAERYHADCEIVELAAILHDIALMTKTGTRKEHHITGTKISETLLQKYNYPQEKIDKVKKCVFNHRSSKNCDSVEEICVADADIIAHFNNIPMFLSNIFKQNDHDSINLPEIKIKIKGAFDKDFNDLSERTKQTFRDRYKLICQIVIGL